MNQREPQFIDRAAAYGDGVFETIAIRNHEPRFWSDHLQRLQTSCMRLGLPAPDSESLSAALTAKIRAADCSTVYATARLVVSAGHSLRGYRRAATSQPNVVISISPAEQPVRESVVAGVVTRICNLRLAVQPALAGIKSLNRLEQVLGRAEWDDPEIFEGLMLDTGGRLICGTMSNVFVVIDSTVIAPGLTRCGVAGIMRAQVVRLLHDDGVDVETRDIAATELASAAEVFLSNSQFGVLPVRKIDSQELQVGAVTRRTQALLGAADVPECAP